MSGINGRNVRNTRGRSSSSYRSRSYKERARTAQQHKKKKKKKLRPWVKVFLAAVFVLMLVFCSVKIKGKIDKFKEKAGTEKNAGSITSKAGNEQNSVTDGAKAIARIDEDKEPTITLKGDAEMNLVQGDEFTDPGYEADGNGIGEAVIEGTVDTEKAGTYTLTYTVTDENGKTASATRTVKVARKPVDPENIPDDKVVYLTFDDGPGEYTAQLLDVLAKYPEVKVTFFVTNQFPDYQDLIAREYNEGHSVAIHTYSHKYDVIYSSEEAYWDDFNKMQDVIVAQTGQETKLLRFPGGSSNLISDFNPGIMTRLTQQMDEKGYVYFDWNVLSGDAGETEDTAEVVRRTTEAISEMSVSVVLQHDIKEFSVNAVEDIIIWGLDNGYTFLPLTESSPTAHHGVNN